jgi:hypothetical protein
MANSNAKMNALYVRPYSKGQKNDFRDAEAIAEAVQCPTMRFVATKTVDQLDLQALYRVRERLVGQRTGIINQIPPSCCSAALLSARVLASCVPNCPAFSPHARTSCHHACCTSSRDWLTIGADSMSASRACPARSERWPARTRHATG